MERKKLVAITIIPMLVIVSVLSGCIGPWTVITGGWENINTEATAVRIWGELSILEPADDWDEGFVWDTEKHDDIHLYANMQWADNHGAWNTFSLDIEELDRATTYHYRAFAEHQGTTSNVKIGADLSFLPGRPRVQTVWPDNNNEVGFTFATLKGKLHFLGGVPTCEVFFNYGNDPDLLTSETPHEVLSSTGDFNFTLEDLTPCETIYYKAIAVNDLDTVDGFILAVTPGQAGVQTYLPSEIGSDYAIFEGRLLYIGGTATCDVWFEYGDQSPDNLDQSTPHQTMDAIGVFQENVDLEPTTTYWVRAAGYNDECEIAYGEVEQFTTGGTSSSLKIFSRNNDKHTRGEIFEWLITHKDEKTFKESIMRYLEKGYLSEKEFFNK